MFFRFNWVLFIALTTFFIDVFRFCFSKAGVVAPFGVFYDFFVVPEVIDSSALLDSELSWPSSSVGSTNTFDFYSSSAKAYSIWSSAEFSEVPESTSSSVSYLKMSLSGFSEFCSSVLWDFVPSSRTYLLPPSLEMFEIASESPLSVSCYSSSNLAPISSRPLCFFEILISGNPS